MKQLLKGGEKQVKSLPGYRYLLSHPTVLASEPGRFVRT
jgi:hypothetical protein